VAIYYGCDPTADSLHVGNLIGLIMLRRFQDAGHRPIALAGGATGMVGDPSGRSDERNLLDDDTLNHNVAAIKAQLARIVDLGPGRGELVDNRDWTQPITVLEFLRDVGKHVTVNQMLARESIKLRVNSEHGISFTEFSYMLLQANDYLWLHDNLGCTIQIGGSDQWGNIIAGVDLIRRKRGEHVHAFSWPLLTAADGSKLGKTTGARVWLDAAKTSPYQFRQHWMQTPDELVESQLLTFSLQPIEQIRGDRRRARRGAAPAVRPAGARRRDDRAGARRAAAVAAAEAAELLFAATRPPRRRRRSPRSLRDPHVDDAAADLDDPVACSWRRSGLLERRCAAIARAAIVLRQRRQARRELPAQRPETGAREVPPAAQGQEVAPPRRNFS
jgi:tyrosyl-tRNA synthetase